MIKFECKSWFTSVFLLNGTELGSFSHFQILTWIVYSDLSRNLENWLILKFVFIHCKTVKVSQDDEIRMQKLIYKCFLDEWNRMKKLSHFQILIKIAKPDLNRNLQIDLFWSLSSFTVKLWKSVKMMKFECKSWFTSVFLMNWTE